MTNRAHIHEFYKKVKWRKFLFFKLEFSNFMANWHYESYWKIQNFSSISLKLRLLDQKKHRDMGCEYHYSNSKFTQ